MPTEEENITLLVCCIKYSDRGRISWQELAAETGITPNACQKRFKLLLNKHGLDQAMLPGYRGRPRPDPQNPALHAPGTQRNGQKGSSRGKGKRGQKRSQEGEEEGGEETSGGDDGEEGDGGSAEGKKQKKKPQSKRLKTEVKEEEVQEEVLDDEEVEAAAAIAALDADMELET